MKEYDLIIIGSGPAGYVAAIRAGQLGMSTAIVEKSSIGGMCLNWGCIPSKTLMESAKLFAKIEKAATFGIDGIDKKALSFNWKKAVGRKDRIVTRLVKGVEFLIKKNGIDTITGEGRITGADSVGVGEDEYSAKNILVATGSRPNRSAFGAVDQSKVVELEELFALESIPESILVYGGNTTACETACMLRMLGKKVTIVAPDKTLIGFLDSSLSKYIVDKLTKLGIKMHFETGITKNAEGGAFAGEEFIECEKIINCSDRTAVLPDISGVDIALDNGFVKINEFMQSSVENIYAVGDVTGQITAHTGSAQGNCAVNHMAGIKEPFDYTKSPMNIYLDPEIASVGLSEEALKDKGIEYRVGEFPMSVNGKAMAEGVSEGFVKILAEAKYGEVVGVHIVAPGATDMIAEAVAIMKLEGTLDDVSTIVHAHPTVSETILEAAFKAADHPLHM
jgi:dihydrolipoamide dehydrogenase